MAEQLPTGTERQSVSLVELLRSLLAEQDEVCKRSLGTLHPGTYALERKTGRPEGRPE